jgi:hypothetical protein
MSCDAQSLVSDAKCLAAGMSDHQLLAAIAYTFAVAVGEDPTPANLTALGKCLVQGMSERQLLAAIAYFQCSVAA